jgi:hypothetical protein
MNVHRFTRKLGHAEIEMNWKLTKLACELLCFIITENIIILFSVQSILNLRENKLVANDVYYESTRAIQITYSLLE